MKARRLGGLALLAGAALTGCGGSAASRTPDPTRIPLLPGARVANVVRDCDPGANAFCALELVVVDPSYRSSLDFLLAQQRYWKAVGWYGTNGDIGPEGGMDSPDHKLRLTYATAQGDLQGIVLGWIKRPQPLAVALSRTMFDRSAAMSMMLEVGSA